MEKKQKEFCVNAIHRINGEGKVKAAENSPYCPSCKKEFEEQLKKTPFNPNALRRTAIRR